MSYLIQRLGCLHQSDAAARHDAFFNGRAGGRQGVFHAVLLFLELDLGGRAHVDHRNTTGELCQALLQLFAVIV